MHTKMIGKFVEVLKGVEPVLGSEVYCYDIKKVSVTDAGIIEISLGDGFQGVDILVALKELLPYYSFSRSVSASEYVIRIDLLSK